MATKIDKEIAKKKERKIIYISTLVLVIYAFFVILQVQALRLEDKRTPLEDLVSIAMLQTFTNPANITKVDSSSVLLTIMGIISVGLVVVFYITEKALRKHDNSETVNGSAHLMTVDELKQYNLKFSAPLGKVENNGFNNMIISKDIRLAIDNKGTRRNCNILVIGGSGAGKSRFFAAPNILQYNANFVITDPSGEMLRDYGKALENNGYEVKVFNLTDVYRSNRYNPFHYINEEKDVFILVNTLIKNTTPSEGHSGDPFWEKSENLLLSALILYLRHTAPPQERTFSKVLELINLAQVDENDATAESPLDILFMNLEKQDKNNLAVKQYQKFKLGAGKTLKSILISVGVRLQTFDLTDIQYLTSTDDFEFERFSDTKQALFVILPTADTTFSFLVSLLYSQLFTSLYNYAETNAAYGWAAAIDEFTNIKVEHAKDKADSPRAKADLQKYIAKINKATFVGYISDDGHFIKNQIDPVKELYYVYTGADLKEFTEKVKKVRKQGYKDKQLEIYVQKNKPTPIGWRGTVEDTKRFLAQLKNIQIKPCEEKCPNHVRLILDEFANIGQIPDFDQKLATMRKYEISCSIILQALSQLKDIYKDKWNTIVANCDTKLFLGCDDTETIEWMLKVLGKKTTRVENISLQANGGGSSSYNLSSIELLTIDQITMMQDNECLVRIRGVRPYYGKKYELTIHPNYKSAKALKDKFVIPVSKDAISEKQRGFIWDRNNNEESKELAEAKPVQKNKIKPITVPENNVEKQNSVPKNEAEDKMTKAKNQLRKEKANSQPATTNDEDDIGSFPDLVMDVINKSKKPVSDQTIKEAVESIIAMEIPPDDTYEYLITN